MTELTNNAADTATQVRAATLHEAAAVLEADAARFAECDQRAVEVLTAAAYLMRTRAGQVSSHNQETP